MSIIVADFPRLFVIKNAISTLKSIITKIAIVENVKVFTILCPSLKKILL